MYPFEADPDPHHGKFNEGEGGAKKVENYLGLKKIKLKKLSKKILNGRGSPLFNSPLLDPPSQSINSNLGQYIV